MMTDDLSIHPRIYEQIERAGYVVVPRSCVAPAFLHLAVRPRGFRQPARAGRDLGTGVAVPLEAVVATSHAFGVPVQSLLCRDARTRDVTAARQFGMWFAHRKLLFPSPEVARMFGRHDHTTVLHAARKIETLLREPDPAAGARRTVLDRAPAAAL